MELDYTDHRPIYEQIKEKTKEHILSKAMAEHSQLPSVRELAAQLTINPNTIQRAYKELEYEGYIYSQKGKGYFVAPIKKTTQYIKQREALSELEKNLNELHYLETDKAEILKLVDKIYKEEVL